MRPKIAAATERRWEKVWVAAFNSSLTVVTWIKTNEPNVRPTAPRLGQSETACTIPEVRCSALLESWRSGYGEAPR